MLFRSVGSGGTPPGHQMSAILDVSGAEKLKMKVFGVRGRSGGRAPGCYHFLAPPPLSQIKECVFLAVRPRTAQIRKSFTATTVFDPEQHGASKERHFGRFGARNAQNEPRTPGFRGRPNVASDLGALPGVTPSAPSTGLPKGQRAPRRAPWETRKNVFTGSPVACRGSRNETRKHVFTGFEKRISGSSG